MVGSVYAFSGIVWLLKMLHTSCPAVVEILITKPEERNDINTVF
jgi:hypothetical protein